MVFYKSKLNAMEKIWQPFSILTIILTSSAIQKKLTAIIIKIQVEKSTA
jgi:hypothetical protein